MDGAYKNNFYGPTSAKSRSYIGNFCRHGELKYDFNNGINSIKMQKYIIRMTFLFSILFAVRRLEFTTDHSREKKKKIRNIQGLLGNNIPILCM